jgi:hypothetical protein
MVARSQKNKNPIIACVANPIPMALGVTFIKELMYSNFGIIWVMPMNFIICVGHSISAVAKSV